MKRLLLSSFLILHSSFFTLHSSFFILKAQTIINLREDGSLAFAVRQARELRRTTGEEVTVNLEPGIYHLTEPLRLWPEDSGLHIKGSGAVVSGGMEIKGWKKEGRLFVADVPRVSGRWPEFRQLWVNDRKAVRARDVSDPEKMHRIIRADREHGVLWIPLKAARPLLKRAAQGGDLEMMLHQMWEVAFMRVKSITPQDDSAAVTFHEPEATVQWGHPWPSPMSQSSGHPSPFRFENAPELLDEPGEWYYDTALHKLYYYPLPDERTGQFVAVIPLLETLVELTGTPEAPVRDVTFSGICFAHTTWLRPSRCGHVPLQAAMPIVEAYKLRPAIDRPNNHKLDNQAWLTRAEAAVELRWASGITFESCRFDHLGGSGLDFVTGCEQSTVTHCDFADIALNGLVAGSFSPEGLETHRPWQPADSREVCTALSVTHSEFEAVGTEDWGSVAIAAGYVSRFLVEHCTLHHLPYSGISLGWGWNRNLCAMRDNRIHANLIYDYARHCYDCAGIYTLGNQPGTVISENVVRDIARPSYVHDPNHWFYLYTDEGSSNITLQNNWTPEEKYLKNACGPGNVWINNGPQVSPAIVSAAGDTLK